MTTITKGEGMVFTMAGLKPEYYVTVAAAETAVVGIDVSTYQGEMDWEKARPLIHFSRIRYGVGNDGIDYQMVRNVRECQRLGIPYSGYWAARPEGDWRKAAASFIGVIETFNGQLSPVIDMERDGGLGKTALESWLYKFLNTVEQTTGRVVEIYTRANWFNRYMPLTNWAWRKPLWVANYTTAAQPTLPLEWTNHGRTWTFWQYSADENNLGSVYGAQSDAIDLNRYAGSVAEFNLAFGTNIQPLPGDVIPPMPPARVPLKLVRVIAANLLNVRAQPTTAGADIGDLKRDSIVPVYGEFGDWWDIGAGWVNKGYTRDA